MLLPPDDVPAWDRGPRCPDQACGGPAVPVEAHHLEEVRKAGEVVPCPSCKHEHAGPELAFICVGCICEERPAAPSRLACARCGKAWRGLAEEVADARAANAAWETSAPAAMARSRWEAAKLDGERAKVARLKEGRW